MGGSKPRGEIAELESILSTLQKSDRNRTDILTSKRQVFQKMVGYTAMGMDVSHMMPKVMSAANLSPDDMLLKKMMYLYICTYAKQKSELALMAINQLQKDCKDLDPNVRGLALRSLCSLRVANLLEYVVTRSDSCQEAFYGHGRSNRFWKGSKTGIRTCRVPQ